MAVLPLGSSRNSRDIPQSWLSRVSENLCLAIHSTGLRSNSANGAPLHFQNIHLSVTNGRTQTFSAGMHVAILAILLFTAFSAPNPGPRRDSTVLGPGRTLLPYRAPRTESTEKPSLGSEGRGGGNEEKPARFGRLAPASSIPLARPRLNQNENTALPVPPSVLDPNAPASVTLVTDLGLPWAKSDTDFAGREHGNGFGHTGGNGMGDGNHNGAGEGNDQGPYANVASPVACVYCPQPSYTEEARKAKLQGKLLLRVLVGTDGRAQRIQVVQGLGMGLDERAIEAVRGWRFSPGCDVTKHPVPSWITIETHFQLF
jgi:periplasmic protein TonB